LAPGEEKTMEMCIPASMLELLDINLNPVIEPGDFNLFIGNNGMKGRFTVIN
jgi:hypothetical protein